MSAELALVLPEPDSDDALVDAAVDAAARAEEAEAEAGSPHRWRMADSYAELNRRGWTQQRIAERCQVDQSTVSRYIACARGYALGHTRPTFWHAYRDVKDPTARNIVASTENEWHTPPRYIEAARTVLGGIDFDPASSAEANETVRATRFCTEADDGLLAKWSGRVWLNPPYGGLAGTFITRLADDFYTGGVTAAIALVNAHCTDTDWFRPLFNQLLCFTDHRIDFDSAGREKTTSSTHGSVFAYFGADHTAFIREFGAFGPIVTSV